MASTDSNDFQSLYPWICNELFERVLLAAQQPNKSPIMVSSYTLQAALEKGENFASQMLRANVLFSTATSSSSSSSSPPQSHSFIIKTTHPNADSVTVEAMQFRKEITAYQRVIPAVEDVLRSIGENDVQISARCYEANLERMYLILEDLCTDGWANVKRRLGLDKERFKIVLTLTAKWHAATELYLSKVISVIKASFLNKKINKYGERMLWH